MLLDITQIFDSKGNYESSLEYAFKAYNITSTLPGFEREEANALFNISRVYYFLNQPLTGLDYAHRELAIGHRLADEKIIAQALNTLGTLQEKLGDNEKALQYYDSSLSLSKKINDFGGQSITLYYIGIVY